MLRDLRFLGWIDVPAGPGFQHPARRGDGESLSSQLNCDSATSHLVTSIF